MRNSIVHPRSLAISALVALVATQSVFAQSPTTPREARKPRPATTTAVTPGSFPAPAPAPNANKLNDYDPARLMAGHVLRRVGFGPSPKDMETVLRVGVNGYIEQQLNPSQIDDSALEAILPAEPKNQFNVYTRWRRWYIRMVASKRQLQEKMTLIWHEHFATSINKVGYAEFMSDQEDLFRRNALGSFRQMLIDITKDRAMVIWLDNNYNDGNATDDEGNPVPPNENYARELLQLFSMGPEKMNPNGSFVIGGDGRPVVNYTETDVRETARALTGFYVDYKKNKKTEFEPYAHDSRNKTILGRTVVGRSGADGAREVEDVVDIIMDHPSTAPFISKMLIGKLATETPTPAYVQRVSTVFANTDGDLKATVRAILTDPEFTSDDVVRSQFKTPIEHFVGLFRAFDAKTKGYSLVDWTYETRHLIYAPPSVFSFYRPGSKGTLVNTALVTIRDSEADDFVSGYDASINVPKIIRKKRLTTPELAVDYLSDALLAGPLQEEVRSRIIGYMEGRVDEEKFRGAMWLVIVSPDFQRN